MNRQLGRFVFLGETVNETCAGVRVAKWTVNAAPVVLIMQKTDCVHYRRAVWIKAVWDRAAPVQWLIRSVRNTAQTIILSLTLLYLLWPGFGKITLIRLYYVYTASVNIVLTPLYVIDVLRNRIRGILISDEICKMSERNIRTIWP